MSDHWEILPEFSWDKLEALYEDGKGHLRALKWGFLQQVHGSTRYRQATTWKDELLAHLRWSTRILQVGDQINYVGSCGPDEAPTSQSSSFSVIISRIVQAYTTAVRVAENTVCVTTMPKTKQHQAQAVAVRCCNTCNAAQSSSYGTVQYSSICQVVIAAVSQADTRVPLPVEWDSRHLVSLIELGRMLNEHARSSDGSAHISLPPVTAATCLLQLLVFFKPGGVLLREVSLSPYCVVDKKQYYRCHYTASTFVWDRLDQDLVQSAAFAGPRFETECLC